MTIKPAISLETIIEASNKRMTHFVPGKLFVVINENYLSNFYKIGYSGIYFELPWATKTYLKPDSIITLVEKKFVFDKTQYDNYLKICEIGGSTRQKSYHFSYNLKFLHDGKYLETAFYYASNDPTVNIDAFYKQLNKLELKANEILKLKNL